MGRTRVVVRTAAIKDLRGSPEVSEAMVAALQPAADQAQATAPVLSGAFRDGLHVEAYEVDGAAGARLVSDVDYAVFVEAESGVLVRSLDAVRVGS